MSYVCQINYSKVHTELFMRLAYLMAREDLCLGPPIFHPETGYISQQQGMCSMSSGGTNLFVLISGNRWHISYDDGEDTATLETTEIEKWFSGGYGDNNLPGVDGYYPG